MQLEWKNQSDIASLQKQLKHANKKIYNLQSEIDNLQDENRKLEKLLETRNEEIKESRLETLRLTLETKKLKSSIELEATPLIDKEVTRLTNVNVRLIKKNEKLESNMQEKMIEIVQAGFQTDARFFII